MILNFNYGGDVGKPSHQPILEIKVTFNFDLYKKRKKKTRMCISCDNYCSITVSTELLQLLCYNKEN